MLNMIKSSYVLKIIANNLKPKIKYKLFKLNKVLLNRLSINIRFFAELYSQKLSKECISKQLKGKLIDDIVLDYLDLNNIHITDGIINLSDNKIENIEPLAKFNFDFLKADYLYLSNNNISNIDALQSENFKYISRLIISINKIQNISVLEKAQFNNLIGLNLSNNTISDINVLEKVNFIKLRELYLFGNMISNINVLYNIKFKKLEILDLGQNKISDVSVFKNNLNFLFLNYLNLSKNDIRDISDFIDWDKNLEKIKDTEEREPSNPEVENCLSSLSLNIKYRERILGNLEVLDLSQNYSLKRKGTIFKYKTKLIFNFY